MEREGARPVDDLDGVEVAYGLLVGSLSGIGDADARAPSHLPGWSRGHVLSHLARNAEGQTRMVTGVRRDEVMEQYPGGDDQRTADIEAGSSRPVAELLIDVYETQQALFDAWSQVPDGAWDRMTRARAGVRPVRDGVLSRWREILVHLVDLDVGYEPSQLPADYLLRDHDWLAEHRGTWTDLLR
jgi:maleylpyruvate isomerase